MAWKKYCVEEDFLTIFHEIKNEKPKRETHQVYSFINDIPIENNFIEDYQMIFTHKIGICHSKIPWFIMIFLMKMASWGYTMGYNFQTAWRRSSWFRKRNCLNWCQRSRLTTLRWWHAHDALQNYFSIYLSIYPNIFIYLNIWLA